MKIQKINENQVRCLLTAEDFTERKMDMRELAACSSKAQMLIQDVIKQAYDECDFDVSENPFLIEAMAVGPGHAVIILTKMEDSEELNKYMPHSCPFANNNADAEDVVYGQEENTGRHILSFKSLSEAIKFAHAAAPVYGSQSSFYKKNDRSYQLVIEFTDDDRISMVVADYDNIKPLSATAETYLEEHFEPIIKDNAIEKLSIL